MNPYRILGVPETADDPAIRAAYLSAIKVASPDTNPQRFQVLNQAYEKIKDETSRMRHSLFDQDCPGDSPLAVLVRYAQSQQNLPPLPFEKMKEHLRAQLALKNK